MSNVLITGCSSGFGLLTALRFARAGERVVATMRSPEKAPAALTDPIAREKLPITIGRLDVCDPKSVAAAVEDAGQIDVLVNNAGIDNKGALLARPFSDWAAVMRVNLLGLALCTHRVLPGMITRGSGRVINLVSRAAEVPRPTLSAYGASKAGVLSFTQALATEVGPPSHPDILINALIPGPTDTAMTRQGGRDHALLQAPEAVYPHARFLVTLPAGGPHGRVFWDSQEYTMYAATHALLARPKN
jgi:NAD(P)-dependent dehydrogenase (short-subunit alcohol dehydrogenase family)